MKTYNYLCLFESPESYIARVIHLLKFSKYLRRVKIGWGDKNDTYTLLLLKLTNLLGDRSLWFFDYFSFGYDDIEIHDCLLKYGYPVDVAFNMIELLEELGDKYREFINKNEF